MIPGSVNGGNSAELAKEEDIDGFLVGGASLKVYAFATFYLEISKIKAEISLWFRTFFYYLYLNDAHQLNFLLPRVLNSLRLLML